MNGEMPEGEQNVSMEFSRFLETTPPGRLTQISQLFEEQKNGPYTRYPVVKPDISLHCVTCEGIRFFRRSDDTVTELKIKNYDYFFIIYHCSNCQQFRKLFCLAARKDKDSLSGKCQKVGEMPEFGPPTPAKLIKLIGPDREIFLKGRRCENQGLGIGAFAYYRRVIENQKNRILDEIIKVVRQLDPSSILIAQLESAKNETQFSKALDDIKAAIPQVLLINGHNPLRLLHSALSEGLHSKTDETCLEIASSVRVVLAELSERLADALKDDAEVKKALARLIKGS